MHLFLVIRYLAVAGAVFVAPLNNSSLLAKPLLEINSSDDVVAFFPSSVQEIEQRTHAGIESLKKERADFLVVSANQRTFANTAQALDHMLGASDLEILYFLWHATEMTSPEKALRDAAHEQILNITNFFLDELRMSDEVYKVWKEYAHTKAPGESLTSAQRYFVEQVTKNCIRSGLDLPVAQREKVKALKKETAKVCLEFDSAIAQSNPTIAVSAAELDGLPADFIANLKRDEKGNSLVGVDYPTSTSIMAQCHNQKTRERLWEIIQNHAYPENKTNLEHMIALRDEMATILGYPSYADYELDDQMVGSVARAEQFLNDLLKAAQVKEEREMIEMLSLDVKNITRLPENKIMPWDRLYLKDQYKKQVFSFDEQEVAAYFPVEKTVAGLLSIYEQFFGLSFKQIPFNCPWSSDVTMITVYDKNSGTLLGYLMLDLYPRPNKFSHACLMPIIPATFYQDGTPNISVSMVIANFPRSTAEKPALLKYSDVSTFFHEFGHALHEIMGRTEQASMAGFRTKKDFIELPSQILEEWLYDREILKKVSSHYQTGKQLPDSLIDAIIALKKFGSGGFLTRQCFFAFTSLDYYKAGAVKDIDAVLKADYEKTTRFAAYSPKDHDYAAFGHLSSYGARVYSYMWSKVFAFDIFEQIKKEGLLNPGMGNRYAQAILVPGGSKDPNELLRQFLGREPNQEAFLNGLGLQ